MLVLTPGNTADCVMAEACVSLIPGVTRTSGGQRL